MDYDTLRSGFASGRFTAEFDYDLVTEEVVLRDFAATVGEEDVFLDIGAHYGIYSILAAANGAEVVAVEPSPKPRATLRRNLSETGGSYEIIDRPVALDAATVDFYIDSNEGTSSHIVGTAPADHPSTSRGRVMSLNSISFDTLLEEVEPSLMKLDVEGMEHELLPFLAAHRALAPDVLYCEVHHETDVARGKLDALGETVVLNERDGVTHFRTTVERGD